MEAIENVSSFFSILLLPGAAQRFLFAFPTSLICASRYEVSHNMLSLEYLYSSGRELSLIRIQLFGKASCLLSINLLSSHPAEILLSTYLIWLIKRKIDGLCNSGVKDFRATSMKSGACHRHLWNSRKLWQACEW